MADLHETYKPMRLREFVAKTEDLGLVPTKAIDPVDGAEIVVMDWHDVSLMVQHYESVISELNRRLDQREMSRG